MSETSPPPSRLSQIPGAHKGGGGPYIAAILVLLAGIGGVVWWIKQPAPQPPPAPAPSAPIAAATQTTPLPDIEPPPPPPPEEDAGTPDAAAAKPGATGVGTPCSGTCNGSATAALEAALRGRGGSARRCYERALQRNSSLAGRMKVQVRVDAYGNACAVSITQDEVHSSEVTGCVLSMFRGAKLPPPSGGCADVVIPLSFTAQEGK